MMSVIVFVSDECTDSQLVRSIFLKLSIPFEEINIDVYPLRRAAMIKLTNHLTTPRVFFNKKYVGGATVVTSLLKQNQDAQIISFSTFLERISRKVAKDDTSPIDERMLKITDTERLAATNVSCQDHFDRTRMYDFVQVTEGVESDIGKLSRDLLKWLPRRNTSRFISAFRKVSRPMLKSRGNRHQSLPEYKDCFSGGEAMKMFMKHYDLPSSDRAVAFGHNLLRLGIIHRVGTDIFASDLFTERNYFRLQSLKSPKVLNSFRIWTRKTGLYQLSPDPNPILTLSRLLRQMAEIIISATSDVGIVDYEAARKNSRFRDFEEAVCQLQLMDLEDMDENTKKTLFLNIYNLMEKHAFVKLCPKKFKKSTFANIHYNIGGLIFSLEEIYHGILRRNAHHPKSHMKMFSESDPRASLALQKEDARIHFAIYNRNHSTSYEYHIESIDEELRIISELYCKSNKRIYISSSENKVIFPKFIRTFLFDFAKNGDVHSLLKAIKEYFRMDMCRLLEINNMLERENINDDRITVLFEDNFVPSRSKVMKKMISHTRFLKSSSSSSVSKIYSQENETKNIDNPESPLRYSHAENSGKGILLSHDSQISNLTWDCAFEISSKLLETKGEFKSPKEDQEYLQYSSSTSKPSVFLDLSNNNNSVDSEATTKTAGSKLPYLSYQVHSNTTKLEHQPHASDMSDYSAGDESSSHISFDSNSKSDTEVISDFDSIYSHEDNEFTVKTSLSNQEDSDNNKLEHQFSMNYSEFALSNIADDCSMKGKSIIQIPSLSNKDSKSALRHSEILSMNEVFGDFDSIFNSVGNEPSIKILGSNTDNSKNDDQLPKNSSDFTVSDIPDDYSVDTRSTIDILSSPTYTGSEVDLFNFDIPSMKEVDMKVNSLYVNMFP